MALDYQGLINDLVAETTELERLLRPAGAIAWQAATPAPGWRVIDQVTHLAYFDSAARLAAVDPVAFSAELEDARAHPAGITERIRERYLDCSPEEVHLWFLDERAALVEIFQRLDPSTRVPWYGAEMSVASSLTARVMETWAHGQDIAEALGASHLSTSALRQVAHLGVRTLPNSFRTRNLPIPNVSVFVELSAPDGGVWTWGESSAEDRVMGNAVEFCLVVTQRRHIDDTTLETRGPVATHWMQIAQAFAGPPGIGRAPGVAR